jgi:hypothetical protein
MIRPRPSRGVWRPQWGWVAMACTVLAAGVSVWALLRDPAPPAALALPMSIPVAAAVPAPEPQPRAASAASSVPVARPHVPAPSRPAPPTARPPEPEGDLTPDIRVFVNPGERPTMAEVIDRLQQAGVRSGLGAFSPPGTRPPLIGLAVPEDFPLPDGYVRHYQATDDGQRIEPILMFAPDAQLVDGMGRPIAMPADRVVPPELAPPGLPLRRIEIPSPAPEPGK